MPAVPISRVDGAAAAGAAVEASRQPDAQDGGGGSGGGGPVTTAPAVALSAPAGVAVSQRSGGGIKLVWNPHPQASTLTGLQVERTETAFDGTILDTSQWITPPGDTEILWSNAAKAHAAGVTYAYTVTAQRSGDQATSEEVSPTYCAVPTRPDGFIATPGTDGSLTVTWDVPTEQNCPVTGYRLEHGPEGTPLADFTVTPVDGDAERCRVFTDLADGPWGVRIRALNPVGESDWRYFRAVIASIQPPVSPSGVTTALSSAGEVTVSWTAAAATALKPVDGYTVKWAESPSGDNELTFDVASTATSLAVPHLVTGQAYTFDVASRNDAGETYTASPATATPCESDQPTSVTVTETAGTGLTLAWTLPTVTCAITGIDVEYVALNANGSTPTTGWTSVTVTSTDTSATATVSDADLTANDYGVRVRTTNNAGLTSIWRISSTTDYPISTYRWIEDTPNANYDIGRVFAMVGRDDRASGNTSAFCALAGGDINCPPNTLLSLNISTGGSNWDKPVAARFRTTSPFQSGTYHSEDSVVETGGPSAPADLFLSGGNASLAVAWSPPTTSGRTGSSIVGYKVEYRRDLETDYTVVTLNDADARAHTITGLLNGATAWTTIGTTHTPTS